MKNVTITVSEDLLARARVAAAREGISLSKFIAEHLSRALGGHADPLAPFDRWLGGPGWGYGPPPALLPKREDPDELAVLRGRSDPDLPPGPRGGAQAGDGTP
ncbi:hypothetical protein [Aquabacter spiritensis]|uniref:hypothetical protein n=1 Tax=Aquabacter spiritensis TaxID=933073 RepID=UPI00140484C3|nr:hypothetical protein [Aquabacter spiritensis]